MRRSTKKGLLVGLAATTALAGLGSGVATATGYDNRGDNHGSKPNCRNFGGWYGSSRDIQVVGLTADSRLVCFRADNPRDARNLGTISGLSGDNKLVGIDYRPANGELVGLGNAGGVYSVSSANGAATKKSQLNVALTGTRFGIDFNPTVDRLRIVSDTGQSLRADVTTGMTTVDAALNSMPGVPATGIVGAAYTNNDADPNTATTLYDIDSTLDQVSIQAPPNAGTLNPTGKLGVDTSPVAEADIYSTVRNGTTVDVDGFAVLTVGGKAGFYKLALFSGKASPRGTFSSHNAVVGIAIPLNQR
jgi:hypothetical protein